MVFLLKIDMENDAFTDANGAPELARILRTIATRMNTVGTGKRLDDYNDNHGGWIGHYQTVRDINRNDVGRYAIKPSGRLAE